MKLLIIHNTLPKYRVPLFNEIACITPFDLLLYDKSLNNKIYGDVDRSNELSQNIGMINYSSTTEFVKKIEYYDIILLPPPDDFMALKIIFLCLKRKQLKVLFWERWECYEKYGFKDLFKRQLRRVLLNPIFRKIDIFMSPGLKSQEYLEFLNVPKNKIEIIGDPSDFNNTGIVFDIRKKHNIKSDAKIILYYGRLVTRKGLGYLLEAFNNIDDQNAFLLICGDGEDRSFFERYAEELGLQNYSFVGYIKPEVRMNYFSQSQLFVLPSILENGVNEAWGLTVNESLESGTPVVASDIVGSAYDLINDFNGCIVPEKNIDALKTAVNTCLKRSYDREFIKLNMQLYSSKNVAVKITRKLGYFL